MVSEIAMNLKAFPPLSSGQTIVEYETIWFDENGTIVPDMQQAGHAGYGIKLWYNEEHDALWHAAKVLVYDPFSHDCTESPPFVAKTIDEALHQAKSA